MTRVYCILAVTCLALGLVLAEDLPKDKTDSKDSDLSSAEAYYYAPIYRSSYDYVASPYAYAPVAAAAYPYAYDAFGRVVYY